MYKPNNINPTNPGENIMNDEKVTQRLNNPSREPRHLFDNDEIAPRLCFSDLAIIIVSSMGIGFLIALLTLGERVS
jgi:hypothetical protein